VLESAAALSALADPLRLRAVRLLAGEDLQVREIQRILGAAQSRVSNHLGVLRRAGLVETHRTNGTERYAATGDGRTLWSSVAPAVTDSAFPLDDERLKDVLEERATALPDVGFDAVAGDWDRFQGPFYSPGVREAALLRLVPRGLRVADVGCGTGLLTLTLAGVAEAVEAVDASARMVRLARAKLRRAGAANVTVRRASAEKLPFDDGAFDAAFAFHLLRHLVRPADALAELGRTVKPGGGFVLVELEPHGLRALRAVTGAQHLGLPRETVRAGLRRAGFGDARFSAFAPYGVSTDSGEVTLATYIVDAVRGAGGPRRGTTRDFLRKSKKEILTARPASTGKAAAAPSPIDHSKKGPLRTRHSD
jgi:ubiquinone/menaquinone biosynthesis C-methylase UbiE/DNA-binding MarR family transcriptional regulator